MQTCLLRQNCGFGFDLMTLMIVGQEIYISDQLSFGISKYTITFQVVGRKGVQYQMCQIKYHLYYVLFWSDVTLSF